MDEAEGDGVSTNTEGTPLLGNGFGETNNCRLCGSVVGLSNIPVKTRGRRDVDDGTVFRVTLAWHERHDGPMKIRKRYKP